MTGPELSDRELEVLQLVGQGMNQEISTALTISESTVKTHINRIFSKLDVKDRTQAAIALKRGIASLWKQDVLLPGLTIIASHPFAARFWSMRAGNQT